MDNIPKHTFAPELRLLPGSYDAFIEIVAVRWWLDLEVVGC